jgi:hypothetical protein
MCATWSERATRDSQDDHEYRPESVGQSMHFKLMFFSAIPINFLYGNINRLLVTQLWLKLACGT